MHVVVNHHDGLILATLNHSDNVECTYMYYVIECIVDMNM